MKFKANGLTWEVQSVQRDNEKLKLNGNECLGITYYKDLQIFLDRSLSDRKSTRLNSSHS